MVNSLSSRRERLVLLSLISMLLGAIVFALTAGRFPVRPEQILSLLANFFAAEPMPLNQAEVVLLFIRIPRILLCLMVGGALSAAGVAYQGLFRNPMVSPDILGVTSAAALGAALGMLLGLPAIAMHILSCLTGIIAVFLVVLIAKSLTRGQSADLVMLILAGIVLSSLFGAILSLIKYVADAEQKLPEIVFWLMGSFARSGNYTNIAIMGGALVLGVIPLFLIRWKINALAFGHEEAQGLGVNVRRVTACIIICSTLLTATAVSLCGAIGWVGLLIPHVCRFLVGPNYRILLPISVLMGALFMLVVDTVCRVVLPGELPVGIITSILGAPLFLYMLLQSRARW